IAPGHALEGDSSGVQVLSGSSALLEENVIRPASGAGALATVGVLIDDGNPLVSVPNVGQVTINGDDIRGGNGAVIARGIWVTGPVDLVVRDAVIRAADEGPAPGQALALVVESDASGDVAVVNSVLAAGPSLTANAALRVAGDGDPSVVVAHSVLRGGSGNNSAGVRAVWGEVALLNNVIHAGLGGNARYSVRSTSEVELVLRGNDLYQASGGEAATKCRLFAGDTCYEDVA